MYYTRVIIDSFFLNGHDQLNWFCHILTSTDLVWKIVFTKLPHNSNGYTQSIRALSLYISVSPDPYPFLLEKTIFSTFIIINKTQNLSEARRGCSFSVFKSLGCHSSLTWRGVMTEKLCLTHSFDILGDNKIFRLASSKPSQTKSSSMVEYNNVCYRNRNFMVKH